MNLKSILSKSMAAITAVCLICSISTVKVTATEFYFQFDAPATAQVTMPIQAVSSIMINTATEQVIAFDYQNLPLQVFACSTGAKGNTIVGTYKTSNYYDWKLMKGNVWSRYAIRFNKGELMHSVPYYRHSPDSLEYKQYNKLGSPASAGCCRLALADAKWLYDNTYPGTTVYVVNDASILYPLTTPVIRIDENDKLRRGWDPTDTDPASPYNIPNVQLPM